jgi:hypothetical protein
MPKEIFSSIGISDHNRLILSKNADGLIIKERNWGYGDPDQ